MVKRMLPVLEALKDERALVTNRVDRFGHWQKRTVALRPPDLSDFTGKQIALVDAWIDRLLPLNGTEISKMSHRVAGWNVTSNYETIQPKTVFIGWCAPDETEIARGLELAAQHGLLA
jgi:hypothetical protein